MSSVLYDAPGPRARRTNQILTAVGIAIFVLVAVFVLVRLNSAGQLASGLWSPFSYTDIQSALVRAWWTTMTVALMAIVLSVVAGAFLAAARLSSVRQVSRVAMALTWVFRGPPVLLLMFWFFYGAHGNIPLYWCAVLGLTVYNAAFIAEILRAGVQALPKGQAEAGLAIGLTESQVLWSIQLPQAVRSMLPALISQVVVILKDSALAYIIGFSEFLRWGSQLGAQYFNLIPAMIVVALAYVGTNMVIAALAKVAEGRMVGKTSGKVGMGPSSARHRTGLSV